MRRRPPAPSGAGRLPGAVALALAAALGACSEGALPFGGGGEAVADPACSLPGDLLVDGGASLDAIPSLQNPEFVRPGDAEAEYLREDDRVIGLVVDGEAWAVPLNIGWWHEIINVDLPSGLQVAVTHCPLTGSSLVFDRSAVGGATFGVSGLLVKNNLVLFDRRRTDDQLMWEPGTPASLWVQMMREARCGPDDGKDLPMHPSLEMTWAGWKELHPETRVVGDGIEVELGDGRRSHPRRYDEYPYGDYEQTEELHFPQPPLDGRRFAKERTLGVPGPRGALSEADPVAGRGALLFPFGDLEDAEDGPVAAVAAEGFEGDVVVFWDERVEGAMAFRPRVDGEALTFRAEGNRIVDEETGSTWRVDGVATEGRLEGAALPAVDEAYVAYWFAWAAFHPEGEIVPQAGAGG